MICKKCCKEFVSGNQYMQEHSNGIKHLRMDCPHCGAFQKWVTQPLDFSNVDEFVMPVGKFKGKKLSDIDKKYLSWAATNMKNNLGLKVRSYCDSNDIRYGL